MKTKKKVDPNKPMEYLGCHKKDGFRLVYSPRDESFQIVCKGCGKIKL